MQSHSPFHVGPQRSDRVVSSATSQRARPHASFCSYSKAHPETPFWRVSRSSRGTYHAVRSSGSHHLNEEPGSIRRVVEQYRSTFISSSLQNEQVQPTFTYMHPNSHANDDLVSLMAIPSPVDCSGAVKVGFLKKIRTSTAQRIPQPNWNQNEICTFSKLAMDPG